MFVVGRRRGKKWGSRIRKICSCLVGRTEKNEGSVEGLGEYAGGKKGLNLGWSMNPGVSQRSLMENLVISNDMLGLLWFALASPSC